MITAQELHNNLFNFIGSEHHYVNYFLKYRYTEGVRYLRKQAEAFWLLEEINSMYVKLKEQHSADFLSIKVISKNNKADIIIDDGNNNVLKKKHISYTDLPEGTYKFYLYDNTLLLQSEY